MEPSSASHLQRAPLSATPLETRKRNPLDLPEILTRVGQYLPLWTGEGSHREFHPLPLLRCSLVSRAWRETLLPTLWYLYDGFRMRNVPPKVLHKYSHLFRIISNTGPFKGPFRCRNLIELWTVYGQEWSRELLVTNPGLKRLVWGGPYHRQIETLEQLQEWQLELKALMGLENLDVLETSGFSLGEGIFVKVLRNNANRLSNLTLSTVEGVTSIDGLELPYLTELHITFGGTESPALVDLVRCCPRLQKLSLTGSRTRSPAPSPVPGGVGNAHVMNNQQLGNIITSLIHVDNKQGSREFQLERLAKNIAACCPELSSIKFSSNYTSTIQCFLHDFECAALVNACQRLECFAADMVALDFGLTEALVGQQESLRTLSLSFHESQIEQMAGIDRMKEIHCVRRIKASLTQLRELKLSWDKDLIAVGTSVAVGAAISTSPLSSMSSSPGVLDEVAALFNDPWTCMDLETLCINGIPTGAMGPSIACAPSTRLDWSLKKELLPDSIFRCNSNHNSNDNSGSDGNNQLFLSIVPLTKLKSLCVDHAVYERILMVETIAATVA
ncbi:hypothetical protein EDD21DRAFT_365641 [Dissophora ornata]|nr:hypothetical protein BGZ58_005222 [Dissophora ornata]KAI8604684.1 hypothetical protein EDD21DRAFT_365641 [Dissophora ornata]